jgi:hypothetical protein
MAAEPGGPPHQIVGEHAAGEPGGVGEEPPRGAVPRPRPSFRSQMASSTVAWRRWNARPLRSGGVRVGDERAVTPVGPGPHPVRNRTTTSLTRASWPARSSRHRPPASARRRSRPTGRSRARRRSLKAPPRLWVMNDLSKASSQAETHFPRMRGRQIKRSIGGSKRTLHDAQAAQTQC